MTDEAQLTNLTRAFYSNAAQLRNFGIGMLPRALAIILFWIGDIKSAIYEADITVPLVSNSPMMSFFRHHPPPEYRKHINKEGELKCARPSRGDDGRLGNDISTQTRAGR